MHDFALVSEGVSDHAILKNILLGYFKQQREPDVHREHPDPQAQKPTGGWTIVLRYLREKKYQQAFQLNRYLIVQVDTDVAEDVGFDVPRQNRSGRIPIGEFIRNVAARLKNEIGEPDFAFYGDRFIFAIGVEQLECWLLPLWFTGTQASQTVNCTTRLGGCNQLRNVLTQKDFKWIRKGQKKFRSYDLASLDYRKLGVLIANGPKNPSLTAFLEELNRRAIQLEELE